MSIISDITGSIGYNTNRSRSDSRQSFTNRISPVLLEQQRFLQGLINARLGGAGRFGEGGMMRQGVGAANRFLASRGINPRSGLAGQAIGGGIGDALLKARQLGGAYDLQLAGTQLPYYQSSGNRTGYETNRSSGWQFGGRGDYGVRPPVVGG